VYRAEATSKINQIPGIRANGQAMGNKTSERCGLGLSPKIKPAPEREILRSAPANTVVQLSEAMQIRRMAVVIILSLSNVPRCARRVSRLGSTGWFGFSHVLRQISNAKSLSATGKRASSFAWS